jgi:NADPH-dependent 2,4-dienoyl-CoA reductase/sulfur reductase-like enzyme
MHYIIIGAGPAGVVAAETLRAQDAKARIDLISGENEPAYSRMAIPYYLMGNIGEAGTYLREPNNHFSNAAINLIHDQVSAVDPDGHTITLAQGGSMNYDKLLIATGSSPFTPPIPGRDLDLVSSCWTLEDARRIAERIQADADAVLIGAGFIGSIVLEALHLRGVRLHVVETGDRMVPRMLNDKAGGLIQRWCEEKGVAVHTSASVESIEDNGDHTAKVKLSNGEQLDTHLVITATGVKPNVAFLEDTEIQIDQGILVNDQMQSSHPDIYAAGDVAQGLDFSTGDMSVHAIQPTATEHGRIAALNMAGHDVHYHGSINMNVLDTLGLISHSFGLWMGVDGGDSAELYTPDDYRYLSLQFDGDCLVGASCTGITQHIGILRGLIETRLPLGEWKDRLLKDPTAFVEAYMASTQELAYNA